MCVGAGPGAGLDPDETIDGDLLIEAPEEEDDADDEGPTAAAGDGGCGCGGGG